MNARQWLAKELRYARSAARLKPGDKKTVRKMLLDHDDIRQMRKDKRARLNAAGLTVQPEHTRGEGRVYDPLFPILFIKRAASFGIITEEERDEELDGKTYGRNERGKVQRWEEYDAYLRVTHGAVPHEGDNDD